MGAWIEIWRWRSQRWKSGVALYTGAWIEISWSGGRTGPQPVAPHMGAWIEIRSTSSLPNAMRVAPLLAHRGGTCLGWSAFHWRWLSSYLTFHPPNDIVFLSKLALTEKRPYKAAQRGTSQAGSVLRFSRPVPLQSRPGRPGRGLPLQRTRATARAVSRVEPWDFTVSPLNFLRGEAFCFAPNRQRVCRGG